MHGLGPDRLPPVLHATSPGAPASGSSRSTSRAARRARRRCGRTSSSTPPTSCTRPCSTAARRRSRSAPCSPRRCRPTWGVYSGYELFEHVAVAPGQRGVPRLREVPAAAARLGRRRCRGPHRWRRTSPGSTRSAARTPRCSSCATCTSTHADDDERARLLARRDRRRPATRCIVVVNLDPHAHPARRRSHLDMPALGLDWHDRFVVHDEITGDDLRLGPAQLRAARPVHEPAHVFTVTAVPRRADPVADRTTTVARPTSDADATRRRPMIVDEPVPTLRATPPTPSDRDPDWFKTRGLLRGAGPRPSTTRNGDGIGDLRGPDREARLPRSGSASTACGCRRSSPRRCATAATTSPTTPTSCPSSAPSRTSVEFLDAAHKRGIRVIIDFVMNHTSDQHPWFQASPRSDPDGPYGDFYVWSDTDERLPGRPDHLRRHRAVELDLGPGAPAVLLAPVLLPPAGPQLRQPGGPRRDARGAARSGSTWASTASGSTPCPTSTSARAPTARTSPRPTSSSSGAARSSTTSYPGRVLLAEANQWPADVVDYFGDSGGRRRRVPHGASTSR